MMFLRLEVLMSLKLQGEMELSWPFMSFPILTALSQPRNRSCLSLDEKGNLSLPSGPVGLHKSSHGGVGGEVRPREVPITDREPHLGKPATPPNADVTCMPKCADGYFRESVGCRRSISRRA